MPRKLLMISTDREIFREGSAVRLRQIEYGKDWDEVHIIVFACRKGRARSGDYDLTETSLAPNVWVYPTRSRSRFHYVHDAMRLGRFIIEKRGVTEMTCQDPFLTAMAATSLKKQFNIPLEIQVHTDIGSDRFGFSLGNKIRRFLALNYLPKADRIRVVSKRVGDFLEKSLGIDASKITIRPISVDTEMIKQAQVLVDLHKKYPMFQKIVLMVSRLEAEKNFDLALEAWKMVVAEIPDAGLVIVGAGSQKAKIEKEITKKDLSQNVVLEGSADRQTVISYMKSSDLYLSTSLFEGYGMTFVEAQAAGLPIVSTDVGVAREVGASMAGWDADDLAAKIITKIR